MTDTPAENPTDVNELFSRDPMKLTEQDIDAIIENMRAKRHAFNSMPATKSGKPAAPKLTDAQKKATAIDLDFKL
jgi:hypothetical protein